MSLTMGTAPFGHHPVGQLNFTPPPDVRYVHPLGRRLRGVLDGRVVIDTFTAVLVHESRRLPFYAFPSADVQIDAEAVEDDLVRVAWDAVDAWYEEDERMQVHPRDPFHRIDVFATSRRIRISLERVELAQSTRARALYETGLPVRWYLPRSDVRWGKLVRSDTVTECAYKGAATHYSARIGDAVVPDVAWSYEEDVARDALDVRSRVCFYDERVDMELDGLAQGRPETAWSRR